MSSGIKRSANRPKSAKHLRSGTVKHFRDEDPTAKAKYAAKMASRANRRLKRKK